MDVEPDNMVWIYTCFQPLYCDLQKLCKKSQVKSASFNEKLFPRGQKHLVILDDVIYEANVVKILIHTKYAKPYFINGNISELSTCIALILSN